MRLRYIFNKTASNLKDINEKNRLKQMAQQQEKLVTKYVNESKLVFI
jgi:hypothetical protein